MAQVIIVTKLTYQTRPSTEAGCTGPLETHMFAFSSIVKLKFLSEMSGEVRGIDAKSLA